MTIILFHGLGCSKKTLNYLYYNDKYNLNDFIKLLERIDTVFIRTDNRDEQSESKLLVRNAEMSKANRRIPRNSV
jgi:hypothetical protein